MFKKLSKYISNKAFDYALDFLAHDSVKSSNDKELFTDVALQDKIVYLESKIEKLEKRIDALENAQYWTREKYSKNSRN